MSPAELSVEPTALVEIERSNDVVSTRRWRILDILDEYDDPVHLDTLAADLATRATTDEFVDDDVTREERLQTLRITLHHRHLPKMDDVGVLDYHADSHRIDLDAE